MRIRIHSVIALYAILLAACTSAPPVAPVDIGARVAEAAAAFERGDFAAARTLYEDLARRVTGDERRRYQIELARSEVALGNADAALAILDTLGAPAAFDTAVAAVRANAYFALGRTVEAVQLLLEREVWLSLPGEIADNQQLIWDGLSRAVSAPSAAIRTGDTTVDGWLALVPLTRLTSDDGDLLDALIRWREEFPDHPAAGGILAERLAALRAIAATPARIALLLPLTAVRTAAEAVRDCFFAAHLQGGNAADSSIQVYDTDQRGHVESFLAAQREGADFVVGPLLETEVRDVQSRAGFVPTLALNVTEGEPAAGASFYQFSLSSDDEIDAIAARAIANGHRTAVVLVASSDRGYDIRDRFRIAFESRGGRVIKEVAYVPENQNFAAPVRELLNVAQSEARFDRLRANLGTPSLEFEPRRRADIDMVFLQASPAAGRVLVPLLRDNNANPTDIPTYATSEIFDPVRLGNDADLNGLIFPELPFLLDANDGGRSAISRLGQLGTVSATQQPRLCAFGFDAYRLIGALSSTSDGAWRLSGSTGDLLLDGNGRVRRILPFAEFRGGRPVALAPRLDPLATR